MKKRFYLLFATLFASVLLAGCGKPAAPKLEFKNMDVTGAAYAREFSLTDHTGQRRTLADYKGKLVLMFFGYTQCPDVCPTTMADMAQVMKEMGPQADQVQVLFVTVDPERDTQKLLAEYVPAFDKRFVGLYGTLAETAKVAKEFKVYYAKVEGETDSSYTVDHTAGTYVFDREGKIRLFIRHGETPAAIAHDLKLLLS